MEAEAGEVDDGEGVVGECAVVIVDFEAVRVVEHALCRVLYVSQFRVAFEGAYYAGGGAHDFVVS